MFERGLLEQWGKKLFRIFKLGEKHGAKVYDIDRYDGVLRISGELRELWKDLDNKVVYIPQEQLEDWSIELEIVDALSDSEFLSFVDAEMKYTESSESTVWHPIVLLGLFYIVAIINSIGVIIYFSSLDVIRAAGPMLILDLITFILGTIYYRKRKRMISTRRHIDLIEARENPMFVSALQKLVSIPNLERSKEYRNRLQYIEDSFGKSSS
ncbi:MAG: hypothetical protein ACTSSE_17320 [Candidatus Thorarchaeota archaeon]